MQTTLNKIIAEGKGLTPRILQNISSKILKMKYATSEKNLEEYILSVGGMEEFARRKLYKFSQRASVLIVCK